jgi:glycogen operon protein
MFNMYWDGIEFEIPQVKGLGWYRVIDTSLAAPDDITEPEKQIAINEKSYVVTGRSIVVLVSRTTG